jgi:hypothetical protein
MSANKVPAADAVAFCAKQGKVCSGKRLRQAAFAPCHCPRPANHLFGRAAEAGKDPGRQKISMPVPFNLP